MATRSVRCYGDDYVRLLNGLRTMRKTDPRAKMPDVIQKMIQSNKDKNQQITYLNYALGQERLAHKK
jgi:hypothetical protein